MIKTLVGLNFIIPLFVLFHFWGIEEQSILEAFLETFIVYICMIWLPMYLSYLSYTSYPKELRYYSAIGTISAATIYYLLFHISCLFVFERAGSSLGIVYLSFVLVALSMLPNYLSINWVLRKSEGRGLKVSLYAFMVYMLSNSYILILVLHQG